MYTRLFPFQVMCTRHSLILINYLPGFDFNCGRTNRDKEIEQRRMRKRGANKSPLEKESYRKYTYNCFVFRYFEVNPSAGSTCTNLYLNNTRVSFAQSGRSARSFYLKQFLKLVLYIRCICDFVIGYTTCDNCRHTYSDLI